MNKFGELLDEIDVYLKNHARQLGEFSLDTAIEAWLSELKEGYREEARRFFSLLSDKKVLIYKLPNGNSVTLARFNKISHPRNMRRDIMKLTDINSDDKTKLIKCYLKFYRWLNFIGHGWLERKKTKAITYFPSPLNSQKALTSPELRSFLLALTRLNPRDVLIAKVILAGELRISEALHLTLDQIDFSKKSFFIQRRLGILTVELEDSLIMELKKYIEHTESRRKASRFVFITRNNKPLTRSRLNNSFLKASVKAGLKRVNPESLRTTKALLTL